MSFLLNTNVVSELRKPNANPHERTWFNTVRSADIYVSVLLVGEIRQGIERLRGRDPAKASVYDRCEAPRVL